MFGSDNQQINDVSSPAMSMPDEPVSATPSDDDSLAAAASSLSAAGNYELTDTPADVPSTTAPVVAPASDSSATAAAPQVTMADTQLLLNIKKEALSELAPLVGHIDQSPEEKFKTTMMLLQSTDNHSLVQTAYDAALQIADDKVRAGALLDIVNEINYFTQAAN